MVFKQFSAYLKTIQAATGVRRSKGSYNCIHSKTRALEREDNSDNQAQLKAPLLTTILP